MRVRILLVAILLVITPPPATAQTPIAYAGQAVRFEQDGPPWTHHYVCYDAEVFCVRLERSVGFIDAATPAGAVSYRSPLPALSEGPHRALLWVFGLVNGELVNRFVFLDFLFLDRPAPPEPPAASSPHAPTGIRFVNP